MDLLPRYFALSKESTDRGVSAKTASAVAHYVTKYLNILDIERTIAKEFRKKKKKQKSPTIARTLSYKAK